MKSNYAVFRIDHPSSLLWLPPDDVPGRSFQIQQHTDGWWRAIKDGDHAGVVCLDREGAVSSGIGRWEA